MKRFAITLIIVMAAITAKSQDYITVNYDMTIVRQCAVFSNGETRTRSKFDNTDATIYAKYTHDTHEIEMWIKTSGKKTNYKKASNVKLVVMKTIKGTTIEYVVYDMNDNAIAAILMHNVQLTEWTLVYYPKK